jgi:plasmid stabilization system protein ParE
MSGFVFHPAAIADLDEIWGYIATDSLTAADRVLEEIHETIQSPVAFPEMGHVRNDLASRPIRFHPQCATFSSLTHRMKSRCLCLRSFMAAGIPASSLRCCGGELKILAPPSPHFLLL